MALTSPPELQNQPHPPADLVGGSHRVVPHRIVLLAAVVVAVPALVYLLLWQRGLFAALGFAAVLPLLILARPGQTAMLLAPPVVVVLLVHVFPHEAQVAAGGALAALALGIVLHGLTGTGRLRREHLVIGLLACVLGASLLLPAVPLQPVVSPGYDLIGVLEGLTLLSATLAAPPSLHRLAQTVALVGAAEGLYALAHGSYDLGRLVAPTLNPNYLGAALAFPAVTAIGLAWTGRRGRWLLAALPALAALVATGSRGAMVSVVAGVLVLVVIHLHRTRWPILIAAVAGLALLVTGGLTWAQQITSAGRSAQELTYNNAVRADAARFALQVALEHPLRGIGYQMFAPYAGLYSPQHIVINTHDDLLRLAAEAGLPALLLFALLLYRGLVTLRSYEYAVLGAAIVTYAVGLLFGNLLSNLIVTAPFWIALGAVIGRSADRRPEANLGRERDARQSG